MSLLIFGGTGLVGSALVEILPRYGYTVRAPTRAQYDIRTGAPPQALFAGVVGAVNAALVRPQDGDARAADRVNREFPHELARLCAEARIPLVHISSDGVFSGRAGPYDEAAPADAEDAYGLAKRAAEPAQCLVLRTSVIGPERRAFASLLCWFLSERGPVSGFTNQMWNGVTSLELARAIARLFASGLVAPGVCHLHGEDVSKYSLLVRIARAFGREVTVEPAAAPIARDRRLRTRHPEFLAACRLAPLDSQLGELPQYCDARGAWRSPAVASSLGHD